jgi:pyruvate formate-lyase/glycerol dehydratase family glycyl radical enzyme
MGAPAQLIVTAQEPVVHGVPSERIQRIRDAVRGAKASICLERPRLMQRAPASRGEPAVLWRARRLAHVLAERAPRIYADELIVGNMTSKRVAANFYAEGASFNIIEDLFRLEQRPVPLHLSAKEKLEMVRLSVAGVRDNVGLRALLRPGRLRHLLHLLAPRRYFITEEAGVSHQIPDYELVVHQGLRAIEARATAALADGEEPERRAFHQAVIVVIEGIRALARRLAEAAEAEAEQAEPARAKELRAIAAACRHVPYEPARTFQEGLQAVWLVHVAMNLEDYEQGLSFGRLDQILLPLYRREREAGTLGEAEATELIASFYLKTCETMPAYSDRVEDGFGGNTVGQAITLGGVDARGEDLTNELSGLFLDAFAQVRTREPNLQVRVHAGTPPAFLERAVAITQLGTGQPAYYGDETIVPALRGAGMSLEDARNYGVIGCVELCSPGKTYNSSDAALFNLPLCVELALTGGRDARGKRVGAATPGPQLLQSFADVRAAFEEQVAEAVEEMAEVIGWLERGNAERRPTPLNSALTAGCLERGRDITSGSAHYDLTSIQAVGLADAGDALYAVRRLVFEERRMSLTKLVEILRADFEGEEVLRTELARRFSKYGRGDPEADAMTQYAADVFSRTIRARKNSRGGRWIPGFYSMTCGTSFGRRTGALANGRRAGARLSNGFSPADGADTEGPTAVLHSAGDLDKELWANCGALNMKFDLGTVGGEVGRRALAGLVRAHMVGGGGMQVQINVLDRAMLEAAKADPSAFPNLLVRVSGYCAYFNDLRPEIQDEIIARSSHGLPG